MKPSLMAVVVVSLTCAVLPPAHAADQASAEAAKLSDSDPAVRDAAVRALNRLGAKQYAGKISGVLLDKDSLVQFDAVEALIKFHAKGYTKQVAALLDDDDNFVRGVAIVALGEFGAKEYAPRIAGVLKDNKDSAMRRSAVEALADFRDPRYEGEIAGLINDDDSDIRGRVIHALGRLGAKDQQDAIVKRLGDMDSCYSYDELTRRFVVTTVSAEAQRVLRDWGLDVDKLKSAQAGK